MQKSSFQFSVSGRRTTIITEEPHSFPIFPLPPMADGYPLQISINNLTGIKPEEIPLKTGGLHSPSQKRSLNHVNLCPLPGSTPLRNIIAPCNINLLLSNRRRSSTASAVTFITSLFYKPESTTASSIKSNSQPNFTAIFTHNSGTGTLPSATKKPVMFRAQGYNLRSEPLRAAYLCEFRPDRSSKGTHRLQDTGAAKILKLGRTCLAVMGLANLKPIPLVSLIKLGLANLKSKYFSQFRGPVVFAYYLLVHISLLMDQILELQLASWNFFSGTAHTTLLLVVTLEDRYMLVFEPCLQILMYETFTSSVKERTPPPLGESTLSFLKTGESLELDISTNSMTSRLKFYFQSDSHSFVLSNSNTALRGPGKILQAADFIALKMCFISSIRMTSSTLVIVAKSMSFHYVVALCVSYFLVILVDSNPSDEDSRKSLIFMVVTG